MMTRRTVLGFAALPALAAKYSGPRPPKADVVYLLHADNLVACDASEAREEKGKGDWQTYIVSGPSAQAKTPMASPIFLLHADKIAPESLKLYKFNLKGGNREVAFNQKKQKESSKAHRLQPPVRLDDGIYRLEVYDSLENGEYGLSPDGSNTVFCFTEY